MAVEAISPREAQLPNGHRQQPTPSTTHQNPPLGASSDDSSNLSGTTADSSRESFVSAAAASHTHHQSLSNGIHKDGSRKSPPAAAESSDGSQRPVVSSGIEPRNAYPSHFEFPDGTTPVTNGGLENPQTPAVEVPPDVIKPSNEDGGWHMRHGWDSQYSAEQLRELTTNFYMYFNDKRHETLGNPTELSRDLSSNTQEWRMRDRLKTVSAILAICLNIGVDPPDVFKTNPSARLECWIDPQSASSAPPGHNAMNQIGKALQAQYESLSMRTRYKLIPDPTSEEIKKVCSTMRKQAKEERILFHYNGHGVPKPTPSGEVWVFNKNYTQYIPLSLYELQGWLGAPSILVYDCSDAALIIKNFNRFIDKHEPPDGVETNRRESTMSTTSGFTGSFHDCIHLAACAEGEILPTNPDLPADLFTSCLTTPIEIAVRHFIMRNPLNQGPTLDDANKIPGRSQERRTPIGELTWIFTAITDTIAWNSLPKPLFKRLFRQDLMVAALFRNFLLAQRIMRAYHCHPQSYPEIPATHDHPLWKSWDLAVEMVLSQLDNLKKAESDKSVEYQYKHSDFFAEQLTAFEVYLSQGAIEQKEPEQLPIVLQVLLSQSHRLRALILLSKFLDLGPWAVNLALGIGIFPYVLKLLQSQAVELKAVMVFIWARILAVDKSCQGDLLKDNGYQYFVNILNPMTGLPIREISEHRAMSAFIISVFCQDFRQAQVVAHTTELIESCLSQINWQEVENPLLRQWCCLCLSMLWKDYTDAKWSGIRCSAHLRLCEVAVDPVPEVRTAMLHALTNFIGIPDLTDQVAQVEEDIASGVILMANDGSSLVRKELVVFFSAFVLRHQGRFTVTAFEQMQDEHRIFRESLTDANGLSLLHPDNDGLIDPSEAVSTHSIYSAVWKHILVLSVDPDQEVAQLSSAIVDNVMTALIRSPLGKHVQSTMDELLRYSEHHINPIPHYEPDKAFQRGLPSPVRTPPSKTDGYFSLGIKRTASVAASLKNLVAGVPPPNENKQQYSPDKSNDDRGYRSAGHTPSHSRSHGNSFDWTRPDDSTPRPSTSYLRARYPGSKAYQRSRAGREELKLPLQSTFFEWAAEYFREPQMKSSETDEPGSQDYNQRLWRRNRNERILESTQKQKEQAGSSRWDYPLAYIDNGLQPTQLCFHQYENHLVVADDRDTVRIWDWERKEKLNTFSNGNPSRSKITGVEFINEDDQALLMTGSSDGVMRIFKNYESEQDVHVVSAFRALIDMVPSTTKNAGLVFDWLQGRGWILVAGDAKFIRVWNAATEICANDIPARSASPVTSLTSDQVEGNIFVAGFGNGAVRVYDQRLRTIASNIKQWKEHASWITHVHMQRGGLRELVSGSDDGTVKLWDIRMGKSLRTINVAKNKDILRSLTVHEHAPVLAAGSDRHNIRVYNMDGSFLSSSVPMTAGGFLNQNRFAAINATAFHPHRMNLACSVQNDYHISIFSCQDKKRSTVSNGIVLSPSEG